VNFIKIELFVLRKPIVVAFVSHSDVVVILIQKPLYFSIYIKKVLQCLSLYLLKPRIVDYIMENIPLPQSNDEQTFTRTEVEQLFREFTRKLKVKEAERHEV
jgi:hypothetical protein